MKFKINPLNVKNSRRVGFIPTHFHTCIIKSYDNKYLTRCSINNYQIRKIDNWIQQNLKGRYGFKDSIQLIDNKITPVVLLGFEKSNDLIMYNLSASEIFK